MIQAGNQCDRGTDINVIEAGNRSDTGTEMKMCVHFKVNTQNVARVCFVPYYNIEEYYLYNDTGYVRVKEDLIL